MIQGEVYLIYPHLDFMKPGWHRVSGTDGTGFLQGVRSVEVELRDGQDSPET